MIKKIYIILIMIVLLSSFVNADLTDLENSLTAVFGFNTDGTDDDLGNYTGANTGTLNTVGKYINASEFSAGDKIVLTPTTMFDSATQISMAMWVYPTNLGPQQILYDRRTAADIIEVSFYFETSTALTFLVHHEASYLSCTHTYGTSIANDTWYQVGFTADFDADLVSVYVNGTGVKNCSLAITSPETATVNQFGDRIDIGGPYVGKIDEIYVSDSSIWTVSDFSNLFNEGIGRFYPNLVISGLTPPVIVPPSPIDNAVNATNVTLNVTHPTTNNDLTYYLYFGSNPTLTESDLYLSNAARTGALTTGEYKSFLTNVSDGTYYYKWKVKNTTNNNFSSNTTQRTWTLDSTIPTITLNPINSFNTSTVSKINQYGDILNYNITVKDETELFGFVINVTRGGVSFFNFSNITLSGHKTFNFTNSSNTSSWPAGVYNINITAADAHTSLSIKDYNIYQLLNKITFDTEEGNEISITSGGAYSTEYTKKKDKYEISFNYLFKDSERTFTVKSNNKIYYLPNSKYKGHFIVLSNGLKGNWIDFENVGENYTINKLNDFEYEITFQNLPLSNTITTKSIGGINEVTETFQWYKGNYTTTAPTQSTFGNTETFILNISRNTTYVKPNATFFYDGIEYSTNSTFNDEYIAFSRSLNIAKPTTTTELINYSWNITITQTTNKYNFTVSGSVNVSESLLDNCSFYNTTILRVLGKDEETDKDVNLTLNILFIPSIIGTGINNSYELREKTNYTFCTNSNVNFTLDSIMEYGDETIYTNRKYYLNDFVIDTSAISELTLYHLNNSKASEITFTVFDTNTGDRVSEAFIKILRYYPGENVFRVVEISKTDEIGETLGKMVLADVFYKFIIEKPTGVVKLDTGVLRILSLTRSFGISFVEDVLAVWDKIHGVSYSTTCTKGTKTCRVTWSDSSNIVQSVTLEVWRVTGLADTLLSSQTTTAAAGTISYTIVEDTATNTYEARAFARSTNPSDWSLGRASFFDSDNPFFIDETHKLASLFPLFLLMVVIIFALIDWGVVGIVIGSLLGMIIGSITGILPISPFYLISFILMAVILIYKLSK